MHISQSLTGKQVNFGDEEILVTKTEIHGKITYANDLFMRVSGYSEGELLGSPHSIIRHPEMPRAIFKFLWDTLLSGNEIFAFVLNRSKNGDHYWVCAHMTPTTDSKGKTIGFHSNRRTAHPESLKQIEPLYSELLAEEQRFTDPRKGLEASVALFDQKLKQSGKPYEEFIWTVGI